MAEEDGKLVADITRVVRLADEDFQQTGGSSRHWVRECFLVRLRDAGLRVVYTGREAAESEEP
jgi:hypothetical protein